MEETYSIKKKRLFWEVIITTLVLVSVTSVLHFLQYSIPYLDKYYGLIFAALFLYVPFFLITKKGRKIDFLDLTFAGSLKSFIFFIIVSFIVFPPFLVGAHIWNSFLFHMEGPSFVIMPNLFKITIYQLVMIALPEEFFFRGYVQGTLNKIFEKKWRILGVDLGWAWIITALIFAFAHSLVVLRWWHFAIFFPGLLFGYMRERRGTITASILFHATSNILMNWLAYLYS